jgi:HK97 family phage portal protein
MTLSDKILYPLVKVVERAFKSVNVDWYLRNGYPQIARLLGGTGATHTGRSVTEDTAQNCSIVWVCSEVIARTLAWLPLELFERTSEDSRRKAREHPLYKVLRNKSNDRMTALTCRHLLEKWALLRGNGYARKVRRGASGPVIGLIPMHPTEIDKIDIEKNQLVYVLSSTAGLREKTIKQRDMFHVRGPSEDGINGQSVVTLARNSIALAQVQEEYVAKFFAQGGRRPYLLKHPQRFRNDEEFNAFREQWEATYGSADSFFKGPVLEGGLEYQELGFSMEDAQFLGSRQFSVPEICRWFLTQPHKAFDLSRATFSNITHQDLEFVKYTVLYWAVNWEQEIWLQLLSEKEQDKMYAEFNLTALERGDFETRMKGYSTGLQNGIMSIDEARRRENMDALPNKAGQAHHIQLNMQTITGTGEPTAAELAALAKTRQQTPAE